MIAEGGVHTDRNFDGLPHTIGRDREGDGLSRIELDGERAVPHIFDDDSVHAARLQRKSILHRLSVDFFTISGVANRAREGQTVDHADDEFLADAEQLANFHRSSSFHSGMGNRITSPQSGRGPRAPRGRADPPRPCVPAP